MKKLNIKMKNCFGIKELDSKDIFDFMNGNIFSIYAKNGSMKTSFAKVFKKIQDNKEKEIKDEIFDEKTKYEIKVNERNITSDDIYVIGGGDLGYESKNISSLLVNNSIKENLKTVLELKQNLLKKLSEYSGLKIKQKTGEKEHFPLEEKILEDFGKEDKSFLQILEEFDLSRVSIDFDVKYSVLFSMEEKIRSKLFQENISSYIDVSEEIIYGKESEFQFLKRGEFNFGKLLNLRKGIEGSNFLVKDNKIIFTGLEEQVHDLTQIDSLIVRIKEGLLASKEFENLEKIFQTSAGVNLKDLIEQNPDIIHELRIENIPKLKEKIWKGYLKKEEELFNQLKVSYGELQSEIGKIDFDSTPWKKAIAVFNDRFSLPFTMRIGNIEASIMGESLPNIFFDFCSNSEEHSCDDEKCLENKKIKSINRIDLDGKDTLSQGEKRALYLLNIIFDIEKMKKDIESDNLLQKLIIIDDIADSFDYKNKYAIVEYLKEISEIQSNIGTEKEPQWIYNFKMIILTHNFDFFRGINNRLKIQNKYEVEKNKEDIKFTKVGQKEPWERWKENNSNINSIISLVPFVRNLIEYGSYDKKYFTILTHILHHKSELKYNFEGKKFKDGDDEENSFIVKKSDDITFQDLEIIFQSIFGIDYSIELKDKEEIKVIEKLFDEKLFKEEDSSLEAKLIYAIRIRFLAEDFIKREINIINPQTNTEEIYDKQYGSLYSKYKNICKCMPAGLSQQKINFENSKSILSQVSIMTPENIHLNSFMYEPILDMDIIQLKYLYAKVKALNP